MTIDGELRAVKAVARQMRGATAPPPPRRLASWAHSLDQAVRGLERGVRFLRQSTGNAASVPEEPPEEAPQPDTHEAPADARERRREAVVRRAAAVPRPGTAGRAVLDAVAAVARDPATVGLTDVQLQAVTGLNPNTVRPRRGELVTGGWLVDSGTTRPHHGKAHRVWVLSDRAAEVIAGSTPGT